MAITVTFLPLDKSIAVPEGALISDAAAMAGISALHLPCGGRGTCEKCTVQVKKTSEPESVTRSALACTTRITAGLTVWVENKPAAATSCIVANALREERLSKDAPLSPICRKVLVQTPRPGIEDNHADLELLKAAIAEQTGVDRVRCSHALLTTLGQVLRDQEGKVSVTVAEDSPCLEIVSLEPGDTLAHHYGIACDLGTTTVSLRLLDLTSGRLVAEASDYNGQLARGADVISRIEYGRTPQRLEELRSLALGTINKLIGEVSARSGVESGSLSCMSIAGNSTMTHLVLGLQPRWLREHPYVPTVKHVPPLTGKECGFAINPAGAVLFSPLVGSYVGGDITAGLLCTDMVRASDALTLFIDIGTNGEIVIGSNEFLMTTACSAGPAFEGSGIGCGMRAAPGAIDSFTIEKNGGSIDWSAIGDSRPIGICGSGLISLLGELLKSGCIDRSGKFTDSMPPQRRVKTGGAGGLLLIAGKETAHGRDIVVTEADLDNLIRTKAAIYAACDLMLSNAGLCFSDVQRVLVAGGFGRFIDLEDAIRIGLLPDIDRSKFSYLGNTSLAGATLALLCDRYRKELDALPGRITYVELSNDPRYMDAYVAALFLPHTDLKRFTSA
jgi:uncharacterized 2Fe-2S/4Fe-4S cluster protein (DUF4445 family)